MTIQACGSCYYCTDFGGITVISLCRKRKLEETLLAVKQLDTSMANLRKWLANIEHDLCTPLFFMESDDTEVKAKLQCQKVIEVHRLTRLFEVAFHWDQKWYMFSLCPTLFLSAKAESSNKLFILFVVRKHIFLHFSAPPLKQLGQFWPTLLQSIFKWMGFILIEMYC